MKKIILKKNESKKTFFPNFSNPNKKLIFI